MFIQQRLILDSYRQPIERVTEALELTDLLRINGVGPVFAKILREIGVRNALAYLNLSSQEILDRFQAAKEKGMYSNVKLGLKDIEYCRRFCYKLDADIEW